MVIPPLPSGCPLRCMSLGSQPSLSLRATAKNGHSQVLGCLQGMVVWPWHDLWACHPTARRTAQHATRAGIHRSVIPAHRSAVRAPSTCSVRSCAGTAMQVPHSRYPNSRTLPGSGLQTSRWLGRKMAATAPCARPQRRHGCVRDSSAVTRWASMAHHRRSIMVHRLWWYLGQMPPRLPRVCPAPLQGPARHTPQDARMLPASCASTDGTRGRPHRG